MVLNTLFSVCTTEEPKLHYVAQPTYGHGKS